MNNIILSSDSSDSYIVSHNVNMKEHFDKVFVVIDHNNVSKLIMNVPLGLPHTITYKNREHFTHVQNEFSMFVCSKAYDILAEENRINNTNNYNYINIQIIVKLSNIIVPNLDTNEIKTIMNDIIKNNTNWNYSIIYDECTAHAIERLRELGTKHRLNGYEKYQLHKLRTCDDISFKPLVDEWNQYKDLEKRVIIVSYSDVVQFSNIMKHINGKIDESNDYYTCNDYTCNDYVYNDHNRCGITRYSSLTSSGSASRLDICV